MDKLSVEIIELKIIKNQQLALWIRLGRNGMVFRQGTGHNPAINTQIRAHYGHNIWFHSLIKVLPDNLFLQAILPPTPSSNTTEVEYALKFYSAADSIPSAGVHIEIMHNRTVAHPLQPLMDDVIAHMLSLTDSMYFDGMVYALLGYKSHLLPLDTKVSAFETTAEKNQEWEAYLAQLDQYHGPGLRKKYAAHKVFTLGDADYVLQIASTGELQFVLRSTTRISEEDISPNTTSPNASPKPWWRFWK